MSPEQAAGEKVSAASDWYSMGVMLHEALTGRLPFVGSALEMMMDKQRFDPPPPGELVPGVPDDLAALWSTCSAATRRCGLQGTRSCGGSGGGAGPDPGAGLPSSVGQVKLVGRARHRNALVDAFAAVTNGRTVVLQVHGPSGAGKSILVQRYLDDLIEGDAAVVLAGRCYQQESVPYKALDAAVDMLARYLTSLPPADVRGLSAARRRGTGPGLPGPAYASRRSPRHRGGCRGARPARVAAPSVRRPARTAGPTGRSRPLVVSIDDAQWGDLDSATLLGGGPPAARSPCATARGELPERGPGDEPVRAGTRRARRPARPGGPEGESFSSRR